MSLIHCKKCGNKIDSSALSCPACGAVKPPSYILSFSKMIAKIVVYTFLFLFLISMLYVAKKLYDGDGDGAKSVTQQSIIPQVEHKKENSSVQETFIPRWKYEESSDAMEKGIVKKAMVESINEVNFNFPYHGIQRAKLLLRNHPRYGKDVILALNKGQFLCVLNCTITVRFDDGKPQKYAATSPNDHSSTAIFISKADRFLADMKKAKRVYIEATFYNEGNIVFEFAVSD